jgi:hypothetical protein
MAIATRGSHVARAIEFFKRNDKYFGIGRVSAWDNETAPPAPDSNLYNIQELVGLKKVDNCYLVIQDENGSIEYRDSKWRIVPETLETSLSTTVSSGGFDIQLQSLLGVTLGSKLRVDDKYEGVITAVDSPNNTVTLDTAAPSLINAGAKVIGGAVVEGARWVYVDSYLRYEQFPLVTYRQVGVYSMVQPANLDIMKSAAYSTEAVDEYTKTGILEVVDNRKPTPREVDQKELLSLIIEF